MERDILTLISKINDRNLQKRRESGFTVYALITIVFLLGYYLIETLLGVSFRINFISKLNFLSLSFNACFGFFIIFSFYSSTLENYTSLKLKKRRVNKDSALEDICSFLVFSLPFLCSAYFFIINITKLDWYLILTNSIWVLILFLILISNISKKIKTEYEVIEYKNDISDKGLLGVITYILGLILIISPIIYYSLHIDIFAFPKLGIIKIAVIIFILPIIFSKIFELNKHDAKSNALENLESEIYLNNLTDDETKKILQDNYLGIGLNNWIKLRKETFIHFKNFIVKEIQEINTFIEDTKKIDSNLYHREIHVRDEEIKSRIEALKTEHAKFVVKEMNEINIVIKDAEFNDAEVIAFADFFEFAKQNITEIEDELKIFEEKK